MPEPSKKAVDTLDVSIHRAQRATRGCTCSQAMRFAGIPQGRLGFVRTWLLAVSILILAIEANAAEPDSDDPKPATMESLKIEGRRKSNFLSQQASKPVVAGIPSADLKQYHEVIQPLLKTKCMDCHGPDEEHANLRIDQINPDLLSGESVERWREIYKVLSNSEMPPDDEPTYAITDDDRKAMVAWISGEMNKASFVRRNTSEHTSFRRLTKQEYNYAIQDLLGLPYAIGNSLPTETASEDGFIKNSEMLQMSAMQFERYRSLA